MSIGLAVKLTKPVAIRAVLPKIGKALQEILGLSFAPEIVVEQYLDRTWVPLKSELLTEDTRLIGFSIAGESETVGVFAHFRGGEHLPEEPREFFAVIEVTGPRTPLVLALTAAVATALGRESGTDIIDNMPFFSGAFDQPAEHFVNAIKVKDGFNDYRAAADAFYKSLPSQDAK